MTKIKKISIAALTLGITVSAYAGQARLFDFSRIPWDYMADKTEFTFDLCTCDIADGGNGAGFRARLAEPVGVIETTNTPWNIVSLGAKLDKSPKRKQGVSRGQDEGEFRRYLHTIAFAPLGVLNFAQDAVCFERLTGASFLYWTEIVPSQTNDVIALFTQASKGPFSKIWYNNMAATMLAPLDCAAATVEKPLNSLHWITGCLGVTGNNTAYGAGKANDPIASHHVFAMSAIDDLHYAGIFSNLQAAANFTYSPVSKIANSMCQPTYMPLIIKRQYGLSLLQPTAWDVTSLGSFRAKWAEFKNKPHSEDDVSTWLWTLKDTCVGGSKCKSFFTKDTN